jgi:hypothetical protein
MEHKPVSNDTNDIRTSWFRQQHYTPEELQQLYEWETEGGKVCRVLEIDERFNSYHVLDTENTIDLVSMVEREQCLRWVSRSGYVTEDGETFVGDQD